MADPAAPEPRRRQVADLLVRCSGVPLTRVARALGYPGLVAFAAWFKSWSGEHPEVARLSWSLDAPPMLDGPDEPMLAHVRRALIGVLRRRELAVLIRALRRRQPITPTRSRHGESHDR